MITTGQLSTLGLGESEKIIQIDVDGTIIPDDLNFHRHDYMGTLPEIQSKYDLLTSKIITLSKSGVIVCLNSDSPLEFMKDISQYLGCSMGGKHMIIAEKGNTISFNDNIVYANGYEKLLGYKQKLKKHFESKGVICDDKYKAPVFGGQVFEMPENTIFFGRERMSSLSMFGSPQNLQEAYNFLIQAGEQESGIDFAPEFNFMCCYANDMPYKLQKSMLNDSLAASGHTTFLIGNSSSDQSLHYGLVGDHSIQDFSKLQIQPTYIAKQPLVEGVVELLELLQKNHF